MKTILKFVFLAVAVAVLSGCGGGTQVIRQDGEKYPVFMNKEVNNTTGEVVKYTLPPQPTPAETWCSARVPANDQASMRKCVAARQALIECQSAALGAGRSPDSCLPGRGGVGGVAGQQPTQQRQMPWGCDNPLMAFWPQCAGGSGAYVPPAVPSSYVNPAAAMYMNPLQAYQPGYGGGGRGLSITFGQ